MKRATYFPLALIAAAILASMAATYKLMDWTQNQQRELVVRQQSANTVDQLNRAFRDSEQELRWWGAVYLQTIETARELRPDLKSHERNYYSAVAQASAAPEHYDLVMIVDANRRIRSVATDDATRTSAARRWLTQRYTVVLPGRKPTGEDWLSPLFERNEMAALGWGQIDAVNELYTRNRAESDSAVRMRQTALAVPVGVPDERYAVVGVLRWRPFQEILDTNRKRLEDMKLESGYAFLIDVDGDTVIGHKERKLLGDSLARIAMDNIGLGEFRSAVFEALRTGLPGLKRYQYPGTTWKVAYLTPIGRDAETPLPAPFHWVLGVGVDDKDLKNAVGLSPPLFYLPSAVVALAAAVAYILWSRRYRATFSETLETIRRARTLDEVTASGTTEAQYNELIEAAGALIVRSREGRMFTPIPNNYVVGRPISDGLMFFGRADELDDVGRQLHEPGNELIIVAGQRRVGKTSLLHQIKRRARGCTCVFVDTQRIVPSVASDGDLYTELYKTIAREVDKPSAMPPVPDRTDDAVLAQLNELMKDIHRRKLHLVLLVDEFENLQDLFENGKMTDAPLKWVAAQLDGREPFSMVVTGSEGMMTWRQGASLGAKAKQRLRVSFLKRSDADELIRRPLLGFASFADGAVDGILRATGCHPLLTQDFCYRLVSRLNAERVSAVTLADVESVSQDLIENAPTWIEDAWSRLDEGHRLALRLLAVRLDNAAAYSQPMDTADSLPAYMHELLPKGFSLRQATNQLLDKEWLQKNASGYRFRCDLHRRWIREYHPLDIVTEASHGHAKSIPAHEPY